MDILYFYRKKVKLKKVFTLIPFVAKCYTPASFVTSDKKVKNVAAVCTYQIKSCQSEVHVQKRDSIVIEIFCLLCRSEMTVIRNCSLKSLKTKFFLNYS